MTSRPHGHGQYQPWASQCVLTRDGAAARSCVSRDGSVDLRLGCVGWIDGLQASDTDVRRAETDPGQDGTVLEPAFATMVLLASGGASVARIERTRPARPHGRRRVPVRVVDDGRGAP